jgi:hypothetical protein
MGLDGKKDVHLDSSSVGAVAGAIHWDKSPGDIIEHHPLSGVTYTPASQSISSGF